MMLFILWVFNLETKCRFIVFNATIYHISIISWRSVLLMEETRVPGEKHRPVIGTGNCKSNYHTITTMMALKLSVNILLKAKVAICVIDL